MPQTFPHPSLGPGSHILLYDVDWQTYSYFLKMLAESRTAKLTYDRGVLEIMSPSVQHDGDSRFLVSLVGVLAEEWQLPFKPAGSTTMRRKPKQAGLEADECFWLANARRMAGRRRLDLSRDPPPDLAIEVELSRRSKLNRMSLYARLGIPEVWRLGKKGLAFYQRDGKTYQLVPTSVSFGGLTPALVEEYLDKATEAGDVLDVLKELRVAVRRIRANNK